MRRCTYLQNISEEHTKVHNKETYLNLSLKNQYYNYGNEQIKDSFLVHNQDLNYLKFQVKKLLNLSCDLRMFLLPLVLMQTEKL